MWEDGYNFGASKSATVRTSLGTGGCDGLADTDVLSNTFFAGFTTSAKLAKANIFPQFPPKLPPPYPTFHLPF